MAHLFFLSVSPQRFSVTHGRRGTDNSDSALTMDDEERTTANQCYPWTTWNGQQRISVNHGRRGTDNNESALTMEDVERVTAIQRYPWTTWNGQQRISVNHGLRGKYL